MYSCRLSTIQLLTAETAILDFHASHLFQKDFDEELEGEERDDEGATEDMLENGTKGEKRNLN